MEEIELLDIANELLIINKATIERLFQEENQNALILYLFYYKTAKWQKHNPIKASDEYCKKCLHWGIDKLQATKKRLKELDLIELIRRTGDKGKVEGWYIKINYLIDETRIPKTTIPISPHLVPQETNTINNKYINTSNNKNTSNKLNEFNLYNNFSQNEQCECIAKSTKERCTRKSSFNINGKNYCNQHARDLIPNLQIKERFKKPTLEEVKEYCLERQNGIDAENFIDFYESKGWLVGKNKMKDWKACIRTWERNRKTKQEEDIDLPDWFDRDLNKEFDEQGQDEMETILKELGE